MKLRSLECCIPSKDAEVCTCKVDDVMNVISKKWAHLIIRAIGNRGRAGYNDLVELLKGISPSMLALRLKELEKTGLVVRKIVSEAPIRVEYSLTTEGQEFVKASNPTNGLGFSKRKNSVIELTY